MASSGGKGSVGIGTAAASIGAGAALAFAGYKLFQWLRPPAALPAPPRQEALTDVSWRDELEDDLEVEDDEPVRAPPKKAERARAPAPRQKRAPRRGPVFIPKPIAEPETVVEPWMKQWAANIDAGIKAQERRRG